MAASARLFSLMPSPLQANNYQDASYVQAANDAYSQRQARIADYNAKAARLGIAPFGVYRRFDWRKPGEGIKNYGMDEAAAARAADNTLAFRRPTETPQQAAVRLADNPAVSLADAHREVTRISNDRWRAQAVTDRRNFMTEMGITAQSTPKEKAAALDAWYRRLQFKNQLPPRGILSSPLFTIATSALGAAFGLPLIQTALLKAAGAGALIPAIETAQTIQTGVDLGRQIDNPRGP